MTREHRPAIEISRYLTRECGIPFKEAAEARMSVLKECGMTTYQQSALSQANLNVYHAKLAEEKKAATVAKRNATRARNKAAANMPMSPATIVEGQPIELPPRPPEKDACISCGDETFSCACDVKRTEDIPF